MNSPTPYRQPWMRSAAFDGLGVLLPPFLAVAMAAPFAAGHVDTPVWAWVLLVLGLDVGHVYATLYRSYWDREAMRAGPLRARLFVVPVSGLLLGILFYALGERVFWSALAYTAVFHFIRQQYGFMRIYSRQETPSRFRWLDTAAIYLATVYPLVFWHTHLPRRFSWFLPGDFLALPWVWVSDVLGRLYVGVLIAYAIKEAVQWVQGRPNLPKNLLLFGTAVSWYAGIVLWNGDLTFTLINVAAHAIPYYAIVWNQRGRQPARENPSYLAGRPLGTAIRILIFLMPLWLLAYLEEGFWDGWIWREHAEIFPWPFQALGNPGVATKLWLVPLLALPQITHYLLDAFLWKMQPADGRRSLQFAMETE